MATVTTDEVKKLLAIEEEVNLTTFIAAADLIVSEDLASTSLTTDRKKLITLFLAAHFATLSLEKGGLTRYEVGESSESYKAGSDLDRGFSLTRYGQQAISLDNSGTLARNATPTQKAEFRVVGSPGQFINPDPTGTGSSS